MKKKTLTALLCTAVLATTTLAACSDTNTQLQLTPNWQANISATAELAGTPDTLVNETLTYEITYTSANGLNSDEYEIAYCTSANGEATPGVYTTHVVGDVNAGSYTLTSFCQIPVVYTYNGEKQSHMEQMTSTVVFKKSYSKFQPVSSKKAVKSYSPSLATPSKLSDCYIIYDYEIEITYNEQGTASESVVFTDHQGTYLADGNNETAKPTVKNDFSFTIDKSQYTYLDNEQIYFALRGLSGTAMQSTSYFNSYNHATHSVRNMTVAAKEKGTTSDFKDTKINGTEIKNLSADNAEGKLDYYAVTLSVNEYNSGPSQELWYAATTNASNNAYRNALLKIKETLMYGMGTLNYTLKTAQFN
ncbi:MAG: hypothetical protein IJX18_02685 [Clostridia bacterium]|nr:hypothetical protein [Clostridia bacterium]